MTAVTLPLGLDAAEVDRVVDVALDEDLRDGPDRTTAACVPPGSVAVGEFRTRPAGTLAGVGVAVRVLERVCGDDLEVLDARADGDRLRPGDVALAVRAPLATLLTAERTALNLLCQLSGVATATSAWVDAVAGTRARIRDSRKTVPGLRALQKYAVRCGGGVNHRMSLGDALLIKDNHVHAAGSVTAAVRAARDAAPDLPCELEVDSFDQLDEALDASGLELVLLDNFTADECAEAVRRRDAAGAHDRPGGLRRADDRHRRRVRGERGGLPLRRRPDALLAGPGPGPGPPVLVTGAAVVGGGIAGTSVAAGLAAAGVERPVLLEAEPELARHTTGRSAASYIPGHGPPPTQALTAASWDRFAALAQEAGHGFLRPRPVLHVATTAEEERILRDEVLPLGPVIELTPDEAVRRWPALRPGGRPGGRDRRGRHGRRPDRPPPALPAAVPGARRRDPHRGTRRRPRAAGQRLAGHHPGRQHDRHRPRRRRGRRLDRPLLALAGAAPIGLTAYRRTIAIARIPPGAPVRPDDPFAVSAGDHWYAKPEGQHLLVSPSEETPQEPGDARPDELDVALALERVNAVTTLALRSVVTTWAGQRTFAPDRALVVGDRPEHPGLHVFAGQGGSGIETAPAAAALATSVVLGLETPADLREHGVRAADYDVRRIL